MALRNIVSLESVGLSFGGKPLFEALSLFVQERDRICLVGRNGAGKTTLMKLITGDLEPDAGKRFVLPGLKIGYLSQQVPYNESEEVRDFVLAGLSPEDRSAHKDYLADIVMEPLGLDPAALMGTLSGGQVRRAALAQALISEPDLLLLDEPTNHLDLKAIEWLEDFLRDYPGALLTVSHDRTFLGAVSRKVFWLDRGEIRTCPEGYGNFDAWAEALLEQEARELQNLKKKVGAEVDWTQGGVTGRRKRNVRRLRELHNLRAKLKSDKASYNQTMRKIGLDPLTPAMASKIIAEFKSVTHHFERDGKQIPILEDFNLRILRGDRIGLLGANGSGKSTFLKLLMGEIAPEEGWIRRGKTVEITYFDQNRSDLDPRKTLWTTLCPDGDHVTLGSPPNEKSRHVVGYLKEFLFDPKAARDRVSTLSGGQQNRLMLAKVMAKPGNVLILDEPTNDLDMDTLDMLQEMLADYAGTLLIVSHDRDFLDRTVSKVLAFEGNAEIEGYIGGYSDYIEAKTSGRDTSRKPPSPLVGEGRGEEASRSITEAPPHPALSHEGRGLAELPPPAGRMTFKLKHELENLPKKMAALEKEMETLRLSLADPALYTRDPDAFDKASRRFGAASSELEAAEERWLELEELRTTA